LEFSENLASPLRVGFLRGSFDPINKGQLNALLESKKQLNLDVLVVSVIDDPAKSYNLNARVRLELLQEALGKKSGVILSREPKEGPVSVLRALSRELSKTPIAILGENVFKSNYEAMRIVESAKFATIMRSKDATPPAESDMVIHVQGSDIDSKNLQAMLERPEETLPPKVWALIQKRGYLSHMMPTSCQRIFLRAH
jgi:nicotinic acid mononucleotide adenylyltransferase